MRDLYIGLMSGTSVDGVDAVLLEFLDPAPPVVLASHTTPYPEPLRKSIQTLCRAQTVDMVTLGQTDRELGDFLAQAVIHTLEQMQLKPALVRAVGTHGQTVRHHPKGQAPFTLQIGDPNRIAELTGITTVGDFRRRDMAAGGEGAPLVPAFHQSVFRSTDEHRVILNIGGISNITVLPKSMDQPVIGFDCGPGNTLMDAAIQNQLNKPYDDQGQIAARGSVNDSLLERMLNDDYFKLPPPKSTGPEHFSMQWLQGLIRREDKPTDTPDLLATLCELTALGIRGSFDHVETAPDRVLVCGGGAHNTHLMQRLRTHVNCPVETTEAHGIGPDWVEAAAFAWLARETLAGRPGNVPKVTGASKAVVLGAIYPG